MVSDGEGGWIDPLPPGASAEEWLARHVADASAAGVTQLSWPVDDPTEATDRAAAEAGLVHQRDLYQLRRPLPLEPADTSPEPEREPAVRPLRPGTGDEAAWVNLNNVAFADHPDQGHQSLATLHAQMAEPWFDPAGFLVLDTDDGQGLAGFCWTKVHPPADREPSLGEIYVIGVAPSHHGRGLGGTLVRAGLDHLAHQGVGLGMLYVDADNLGALGLYAKLGFTRHHVRRVYQGAVACGGAMLSRLRRPPTTPRGR